MMKLDRFKLLFIHLPDFQLRNVPKRQLYPPHLTVYKIAHIFKGTALSNVAFTFRLLKKKIKIKPSADEICSRLYLSSFLFEIYLRLFKQKREIKTKGKLSCVHMRRKGIIKKRNILPGKSDSSGSIITPSLVKTPFRCYVPLSSFFFSWHQRNIKSLISPWLLRFHFCSLMSLWKNKMRLAGCHKGSPSALFFQFDLSKN